MIAAGLSFAAQPGCESCHSEIAASFRATGMGQSVGEPSAEKARFRHDLSSSVLTVNGTRHRIERGGLSAEYAAALRIGSGKIGSSFAVRIAGQWFQSPVSWYSQSGQFRISPGYDSEKYPDFDRRIGRECLNCHASDGGSAPAPMSCERCHGDGQAHASQPSRRNIVNPARLAAARRDSVCEQCHLPGAVRVLNPGRQARDYQPGQLLEATWTTWLAGSDFRVASHAEQFAASACVRARSAELWCGSCHNPHPTKARPAKNVDSVCSGCHQVHDGGKAGCASCHMPKRNVGDVVHTAYTDHRIQRPGFGAAAGASDLRAWREPPSEFAGRNFALALFERAATSRDAAGMREAFRRLSGVRASGDPPVLSALGAISLQAGDVAQARSWLEEVVKLQPRSAEAHFRLGRAEQTAGRAAAAIREYEAAMRLDPLYFDAYAVAAQLHRSRGDWESYRRVLRQYLQKVPQSIAARQALAVVPQ